MGACLCSSSDPFSRANSGDRCCAPFLHLALAYFQPSSSPLSCQKFQQRYTLGEELGRGSSGVTRICVDKFTGEKLACKTIQKWRLSDEKQAYHEVEILKRVSGQHPGVITLKAVYSTAQAVHLVMELCSEGSLMKRMRNKSMAPFTEPEAASLIKSLMESVQFCHSKGVVHRDITLANVLVNDQQQKNSTSLPTAKLADFGLATHLNEGEKLSEIVGTVFFVAPEVVLGSYGKEVDVWSCGVVLYAILSGGELPFFGKTAKSTFSAILTRELSFKSAAWRKVSALGKSLIRGMLCREPRDRLTPAQVLEHQWISHCASKQKVVASAEEACEAEKSFESREEESPFVCSNIDSEIFWGISMRKLGALASSLPRFGKDLLVAMKLLLSMFFMHSS